MATGVMGADPPDLGRRALPPPARPRLGRDARPFALAAVLAFAVLALPPVVERWSLVAAAAAITLAVATAYAVAPWGRLPEALRVLPPLGFLLAVALLRESQGGAASGFGTLVMLPVFWVALYGRRSELALILLGVTVTFAAPVLLIGPPAYGEGEVRRVVLWVAVSGIVGYSAQSLVAQIRGFADEILAKDKRIVAMVDGARDHAIFTVDLEGSITSWGAGPEAVHGWRPGEVVGRPLSILYPPEEHAAGQPASSLAVAAEGGRCEAEGQRVRADGSSFFANVVITALTEPDGSVSGFVNVIRDVTESHEAERARREADERFHTVFAHAPMGVALTSVEPGSEGRYLEVNEAMCELTGHAREDLLATSRFSITHPDDVDEDRRQFARLMAGEVERVEREKRFMHAAGHAIWALVSAVIVRDDSGVPLYLVTQALDIGDRKRFEGQLQYLADHDPLTGLFNRRRLEEELHGALAWAARDGSGGAVMVLDLDNFKYVNDALGHSAGDEVIAQVGSVLKQTLRTTDIIARLGGDEFAVVLRGSDEEESARSAERVGAAIRERVGVGGPNRRARSTASIGITHFSGTEELTADELLVEADIAMYEAKEAGRDRFATYRVGESRRERMESRFTWVERVRHALEHDGFELFAQPLLALDDESEPRFELLLRMRGDGDELIPPGSFLHVAERFDMVQAVDRWVIRRTAELLGELKRLGRSAFLHVNLSGKSISEEGLPDFIAATLHEHGADPSWVVFEVTETTAIVNIDRAKVLSARLRELGCSFALDDFGAGFASFYYLKHVDFDFLKIDGDFVRELTENRTDVLVVEAVVALAHGLGRRTVAEWVGDAETLERLRALGVDYAQGFHVGRPAPLESALSAGAAEAGL